MSSQLRNFFFQLTSVLRPDGTTGGIRFRDTDKPSQATFQHLVDSVTFKKEPSDRAKMSAGSVDVAAEQGLAVLANDTEAKTNAVQPIDRSIVAQPHQLPTTETDTNDFTVATAPADGATSATQDPFNIVINGTTRNNFVINFKDAFVKWILRRVLPGGGGANHVITKVDAVDYNYAWADPAVNTNTTTAINSAITTNNNTVLAAAIPIGTVNAYVGVSNPNSDWLVCDGQQISMITYAALYAIVGVNTFGADGGGLFFLPDLRQKQISGARNVAGYNIGVSGGSLSQTLSNTQLPAHNHTLNSNAMTSDGDHRHFTCGSSQIDGSPTILDPAGYAIAWKSDETNDQSYSLKGDNFNAEANAGRTSTSGSHTHTLVDATTNNGNYAPGSPIDIRDSYLALNYIIKAL